MSSDIFNIRFGSWHFKITRGVWYPQFIYNGYHTKIRKINKEWKWFTVYSWMGRHF